MGGKEIEFEVERRREDRALAGKKEPRTWKGKEVQKEEVPEDGSWEAYFQNPKTVDNMKFFVMAQSFVMFLTFGLPQVQMFITRVRETFFGSENPPDIMVDFLRVVHAIVVLVAVGSYSVFFFRGLGSHLSEHMYSVIEEEMKKNPHMKKDFEEYKAQVQEQERQREQMKELEEQAKRIQEQMKKLSEKKQPKSFTEKKQPNSFKYVHMEGVQEIGIGSSQKEPPNQSMEQSKRIEL